MRNLTHLLALLVLVFSSISCVGPAKNLLSNMDQVGTGQTVVVGKVVVTPALLELKTTDNVVGNEGFKAPLYLLTDSELKEISDPLTLDDYKGRIEAPIRRTFFAQSEPSPFYILGGVVVRWDATSAANYILKGAVKVDIQPGDRVVYIGTIHYYRDEFYHVTNVTVEDEYDQANDVYKKRFGGMIEMKKALAVAIKP